MERVNFRITLNLDMVNHQPAIYLKQSSIGSIRLSVRLQKDGKPYDISDLCKVTAYALLPEEKYYLDDCTVEDGAIIYDIDKTIPAGKTAVEFTISEMVDGETKILVAPTVYIISTAPVFDDSIPEATSNFSALQKALAEAKAYSLKAITGVTVEDSILTITFADETQFLSESLKGDKGDKGDQGEQGIQGDQGIQGEQGKPFTYEDFTDEQLALLKGENGSDGADGTSVFVNVNETDYGYTMNVWDAKSSFTMDIHNGEKGETGDKGEKGDQGEQGSQGDPGYTPVRGIDYWTEEDIAYMKQYVDDAILGGEW